MSDLSHAEEALVRARKAFGGSTRLAEALGISQPAVSQWTVVPINRVEQVSKVTGIPPHELRPDLFALFKKPEAAA